MSPKKENGEETKKEGKENNINIATNKEIKNEKKKNNFLNNLIINKDYSKQLYFESKYKTPILYYNKKINGKEFNNFILRK